jgi:hypothetical protein
MSKYFYQLRIKSAHTRWVEMEVERKQLTLSSSRKATFDPTETYLGQPEVIY